MKIIEKLQYFICLRSKHFPEIVGHLSTPLFQFDLELLIDMELYYKASTISSFPKSRRYNACVFYEEFSSVLENAWEWSTWETTTREFHQLDNVCTLNNASDNFPDIETSDCALCRAQTRKHIWVFLPFTCSLAFADVYLCNRGRSKHSWRLGGITYLPWNLRLLSSPKRHMESSSRSLFWGSKRVK